MSDPSIQSVSANARSPLPLGHRVGGMQLIAVLGTGRFGITYLASAAQGGAEQRIVLREYMPAGLATRRSAGHGVRPLRAADRPDFDWGLARLRQETEALKAVEHPGLARVYGLVEENGTGYRAEEFVEGTGLAATLERRGKLPEAEIRYLLSPMLDALEQVHRIGLVHGGIDLDTIIFRGDSTPVLVGYGAPRPAPPPGTEISWNACAAHELGDSRASVGPWTDIYAIGAALYRVISGTTPASGPVRQAALASGADDPLPVLAAAPGYSISLLAAIGRALEPDERDRPQSLAAWRALLAHTASEAAAELAGAPRPRRRNDQPLLFDLDPASKKADASPAVEPQSGGPALPANAAARRAPPAETPPPLLGPAVAAAMNAVPAPPSKGKPASKFAVPRRPWIWGAALAVVVIAGVLGLRHFQTRPDPAVEAARAAQAAAERAEADRRALEMRRLEEARKAEETRKLEEARRAEAAKVEEAKRAEAARKADEAKRVEEARRAEEARKAHEARLAEEAKKAEEARKAEAERLSRENTAALAARIGEAEAAIGRKDWVVARTALTAAEKIAPENPKLAEIRGLIVAEIAARVARADEAAARREWADAEKMLADAYDILPDSATIAAGRERIEKARRTWEASRIALGQRADLLIGEALAAGRRFDFAAAAEKLGEAEQALEGFAKDDPLRAKFADAVAEIQRQVDDVEFERHRVRDHDTYLTNRQRADMLFDLAQKELHEKKNAERACVLYREAGDLGHVGAQNQLGVCFASGRGTVKDELEAYNWFRRAAEGGNAVAQYNMAHAYAVGSGVAKHMPTAAVWAKRSADQGYPKGLCQLGIFTRDGQGMTADAKGAVKLFRQGADKGEEWCMALLAEAYERGAGVARDVNQARVWYGRAAAKGYEPAKERLKALR